MLLVTVWHYQSLARKSTANTVQRSDIPQSKSRPCFSRDASQSATSFGLCILEMRRNTRHHSQVLCIECSVTLSFSVVLGQRPIWCKGLSPCSVVCPLQRRSINCRRRNTGNQPLVSSVKTTGPPQCVPKPLLQLSSLIPHPSSLSCHPTSLSLFLRLNSAGEKEKT
jgi:hypothetical protein